MTASNLMQDDDHARWRADTLRSHLALGREKCVSYLPIRTVEVHLALSVPQYLALIVQAGHRGLVLGPDCCRVSSGAVYAFGETDLEALLEANRDRLTRCGWPATPEAFVATHGRRLDRGGRSPGRHQEGIWRRGVSRA